jgi:hypothetical protein
MAYAWNSIRTWSFWRYALFSTEAIATFFAALGVLSLFIELADEFHIYTKDRYSHYGLIILIALAIIYTLSTRRPISRVVYKVPRKDLAFAVKIGDLFDELGEMVISSNSTFDTDMSTGLIARDSLQGQLAVRFFDGQTSEIDRQIANALEHEPFELNDARPGKKKEYPIGTVARVSAHGRNFYFVAMSHLNASGTAQSDPRMLDEALENLWINMAQKAEFGDIIIPAMGTGRGRVPIPRKKVIERIAQSFADASREKAFSNRLTIVVHPKDAEKFSLNLFEVRDYLSMSLHI